MPTLGGRVIRWMEGCLVHTEGEWRGKPFRLLPWQKRLLLELFRLEPDPEWIPVPGQPLLFRRGLRRRYRQAFITVAKKNGKTELAEAIALYLLIGDGEPSPKGVCSAAAERQAGLAFRGISTMLLESPVLRALVGERNVGERVIEVPSIPGSRLERIAAEAGTNDGPSLHFGVLDEIHEWPGEQGRRTHGVITNAGAARKNPLFVSISTAGVDEDTLWGDLYARGEAALADPASDPTFYFFRVEAPAGSDWKDRAVWEAANPSANVTVTWSFYQGEWVKGEHWCRRYYLNQRLGRAENAYIPPDEWDTCADPALPLSPSLPIYAAVRISSDHRAGAIAIAQRRGDRVVLRVHTFPRERRPDDEEYLDVAELEDDLAELHRVAPAPVLAVKRYRPGGRPRHVSAPGPEVAYHGSFFERSAQLLRAKGLVMVDVPSSPEYLAPAAGTLKELVLARKVAHDGDPELARQVGNVVTKQDIRGERIQPPTSARKQVHAALAAMTAVHRAMTAPAAPSRAVRGPIR